MINSSSFPRPPRSSPAPARPQMERVSHVVEKWPKLPDIKYPILSPAMPHSLAIVTADSPSASTPSPSLATKGHLRLPFWPSFCAKSRLCPLTPNLRAATSASLHSTEEFLGVFYCLWRGQEGEREAKKNIARRGRQNGFFPHALSSLFRLLLLPVKQLLMICRQMVSGRRTFPPLALLQTGGWERRSKTFAPSALR